MIYLIDTIGVETGMHKYDEAFCRQCLQTGEQVGVISNFDDSIVSFRLKNYYHGNKVSGLLYLFIDLLRMSVFRIGHRKELIIYQSFGFRPMDILFCIVFLGRSNFRILVHDLFQITGKEGRLSTTVAKFFYSHCFGKYICHSVDVKESLESLCHRKDKDIAYFPHLEYSYSTEYDIQSVGSDILDSIKRDRINVLCFGQVRLSKGIDVLLDAWKLVDQDKFNLVIAGTDKDKLLFNVVSTTNMQVIPRYISDNELNYLFSKTDAVVLPYREIYQSGVLETVVHFRKKAILSPVRAFMRFADSYRSFVVMMDKFSPDALAAAIMSLSGDNESYSSEDLARYASDHNIQRLLEQL